MVRRRPDEERGRVALLCCGALGPACGDIDVMRARTADLRRALFELGNTHCGREPVASKGSVLK